MIRIASIILVVYMTIYYFLLLELSVGYISSLSTGLLFVHLVKSNIYISLQVFKLQRDLYVFLVLEISVYLLDSVTYCTLAAQISLLIL